MCNHAGSNLVHRLHQCLAVGVTLLVAQVGTKGEAEAETETETEIGIGKETETETETEKEVVMTIVGEGIAHTSLGKVVLHIGCITCSTKQGMAVVSFLILL